MLKIHAAGNGVGFFSSFVEAVNALPDVEVIDTSTTGAQTVEAMKSGNAVIRASILKLPDFF